MNKSELKIFSDLYCLPSSSKKLFTRLDFMHKLDRILQISFDRAKWGLEKKKHNK